MEKVFENLDYEIYSDGMYYYVYLKEDTNVIGWEMTEYTFTSSSLDECLYYVQ